MSEFNLKLNINGVETAVASVEDLEIALKATKDELKSLQIGSEAFNVAAANAQKLDSALKNVKLATEGVDTKQLAQSFAKLGETVTGAFAIATQAGELFGSKNEDLAKAQVKAQQAIAVVMGARAVAEGIIEGRIAARLILEKVSIANTALMTTMFGAQAAATAALAVSTDTATVAQYALNAAMNLNPILLIVTAIGALVAAFTLLGDSEEDEIERTERLNKAKEDELVTINKVIDGYKEQKSVAEGTIVNEIAILKAAGASKEVIYKREQELLNFKINTLKAVAQSGRELTAAELKEKEKLNTDLQVLALNYRKSVNDDEAAAAKKRAEISKQRLDESAKLGTADAAQQKALQDVYDNNLREIQDLQTKSDQDRLALREKREIEATEKLTAQGIIQETVKGEAINAVKAKYVILNAALTDEKVAKENAALITQANKEGQLYEALNQSRIAVDEKLAGQRSTRQQLLTIQETNAKIAAEADGAKKLLDAEKVFQDEKGVTIIGKEKDLAAAKAAIAEDTGRKVESIEGEFNQKRIDAAVKTAQEITAAFANVANAAIGLFSALAESQKINSQNELIELRNANQEKLNEIQVQSNSENVVLNDKLKKGLISQAQYDLAQKQQKYKADKAKQDADRVMFEKEKAAKIAAFKAEKDLKIAQASIAGLMGAVSAFAGAMSLGPIAGPIVGALLAGLVVATTAVNVANIQKTEPDVGVFPEPEILQAPDTSSIASAALPNSSVGGFTGFDPSTQNQGGAGSIVQRQSNGNGGGGSQRVYVVESDITNAQMRVAALESAASFG